MSTAASEAWQSLKEMESEVKEEYRKRSTTHSKKKKSGRDNGSSVSINDIMKGLEEKRQKSSAKKKKKSSTKNSTKRDVAKTKDNVSEKEMRVLDDDDDDGDDDENENDEIAKDETLVEISAQEMLQKISRDLNILNDSPNSGERRSAICRVHDIVTCQGKLGAEYKKPSAIEYNDVFEAIGKPIFKRYADPVERCRERAFAITKFLFCHAADFVPVLGYFFPALMARAPPKLGFDEEMKVFVTDFNQHEQYRRGRAVDRQDAQQVEANTGALVHTVVEDSEEVRLLATSSLNSLIERLVELDSCAVLNPYFADMVLYLQCQLRDLFPDLKVSAANAIEKLAVISEFESGMCFFAVALVRALLPLLRHRHSKVRIAAVDSLRVCMIVPNRAKRKGAGTEAIVDLVGFKEENVLNVASFYKPSVSVNYLAELTSDPIVHVRERVAVMLSTFLVDLEDRYDHQQRLVPYLLDFLTDDSPSVSSMALSTLGKCGKEYEEQHTDDIIDRRQYGIDGDDRCNLEKPLPFPFTERPRIGIRMYVRGNTKRFIFALVGELTNWQSKTRLKSANLLKMVTILCEEYLTMEMHKLLPSYIKALHYARDDNDKELENVLCEVFELAGRYTAPNSYVHYILPRLRGDVEVTQFGVDVVTRCCVMDVLRCFIEGSKSTLIPPYLSEIVDAIADPYVIDTTSDKVHRSALTLIEMVLFKVQGKGLSVTEAHFQSTGRLKTLNDTLHKAFCFVFHALSNLSLNSQAAHALTLLACLDSDSQIKAHGVAGLCLKHIPRMMHALLHANRDCSNSNGNDIDDMELSSDDLIELDSNEFRLLEMSLLCPVGLLRKDDEESASLLSETLSYLMQAARVILRSAPSSLSSRFDISLAGSQDETSVWLHQYSKLLLFVLNQCIKLPDDSSTSFEASVVKHFALLFPEECKQKVKEPSISSNLRRTVGGLFQDLIGAFVTTTTWSNDVSLQTRRLEIMAALIHTFRDLPSSEFRELFQPCLRGIFEVALRSSLLTSAPTGVRTKASVVFEDLLAHCFDTPRLTPYSKQKQPAECCAGSIAEGVELALSIIMESMLDDANDDIRVHALESLMHLISFIRPHRQEQEFSSTTSSELPPCSPSVTSFEGMVEALLMRAINGNPTQQFCSHLDLVLRSIAVLDTAKFEDIVRSKLPLLVGVHKPPSVASDLFSSLLDHCDMMKQFEKKK